MASARFATGVAITGMPHPSMRADGAEVEAAHVLEHAQKILIGCSYWM
jgi:hypothetical protein